MNLPGLAPLRTAIDDIDRRILELLRARVELVLQVGELKRQHDCEVYDADRERRVLDGLDSAARSPLTPETTRRIFERIIDESRTQEQRHVSTMK